PRRRLERQARLHEPEAARADARIHALTALAGEAAAAVGVLLACLVAADHAVAARRRLDRADALHARRARVRAREAGLAALLAGVGAAVAALEELHLVRSHVDARADGPRPTAEVERGRARRVARIDGRTRREQVEVAARYE